MCVCILFNDQSGYIDFIPDSIPPSDRRWLLVARSADFADVGPTLAQRLTANHNSGYISLHFADVGPTLVQWWIFIQDGGEQ